MTVRLPLLCLFIPMTAACVGVVSIDVEDNSVNFGNIEASFPLQDGNTRIRLRGTAVSGDFKQSISSGTRIIIDGNTISGPAEVSGDIDLDYYSVVIGWDRNDASLLPGTTRSSYYLGLAQTRFDLNLDASSGSFSTSDHTSKLYAQWGFHHSITESIEIGFTWAASLGREFSGINEIDLRLDYQLAEELKLSGGYRWLDYEYGLEEDESNIEVDFRGPVVGIYMHF